MGQRSGFAVVVVCLLVLAGCSGFPGGEAADDRTDTVTAVPVTSEAPTATGPGTEQADSPPGVSLDGSLNVSRLVEAHEAFVADRSYQWTFRYGVASETPQPYDQNVSRRVVVGDGRFLVEQETAALTANRSLYVAGNNGYLRVVRGNRTNYDVAVQPRDHRSYAFAGDLLRQYLTGVSVNVTAVERDGRTYYRLHAADTGAPAALRGDVVTVSNYTVTAYATPAGFVRTLVVEFKEHARTTRERVSVESRYDAVGSTAVDRPDWVAAVTPVSTTDAPADPETNATVPPPDDPTAGPPTAEPPTAALTETASNASTP